MADAAITDSVEIWKPVPGWEGLYEASSQGRIRSLPREVHDRLRDRRWRIPGGVMKPGTRGKGYKCVALTDKNKSITESVHKLVCLAFHGRPSGKTEVAHADGNPANNSASNLRWATSAENHADKEAHGRTARGERSGRAILSEADVLNIRERYRTGTVSNCQQARDYGVHNATIFAIVKRKSWTHI